MIRNLFTDTFRQAETEADITRLSPKPGSHRKTIVILCWAALALLLINYLGNVETMVLILRQIGLHSLADSFQEWSFRHPQATLNRLIWWALVSSFNYLIVPLVLIRLVFREPIRDYGFRLQGIFNGWLLYATMLVVMVPLVAWFSGTSAFLTKYPFYTPESGESLWPNFWIWESCYLLQFVALEFFFRGFMTLGLRERFGYYSVFVMMVPYCMIHFQKPLPETFGAIIAGVVLGTLSMKSRSIWLGVLIHYSVAITMDLFALWRKGLLFPTASEF